MSNASSRFRTPLMQQIIRSAQHQQRELSSQACNTGGTLSRGNSSIILAMAGISKGEGGNFSQDTSNLCLRPSFDSYYTRRLNSLPSSKAMGQSLSQLANRVNMTSHELNDIQKAIVTRRTVNRFESSDNEFNSTPIMIGAIERAVQCAMSAPNHKRTEPFTFKQILSSSSSAIELAEIAYHAALRSKGEDVAHAKREKWSKIPAFLVALVNGQPDQNTSCKDQYTPIDIVMPISERQLEDYASTCVAIQNVMLSLHSEGFGSKWATGPIVRTHAFRRLARLKDDELVVGLLMIGWPKQKPNAPRKRRQLKGDVLREI